MEQNSAAGLVARSTDALGPVTTVHFILLALLALAVIIALVVAIRLRARARHERADAAEASRRIAEVNDETTDWSPPTAPEPPPLADTPVVATAPLHPSPAVEAIPARADDTGTPLEAASADDLTRMKGVGPKLVAQLAALGITRFDQLAGLTPAEADALDARLGAFKGRLHRDRWVEQAGYLARDDLAGFESVFGRL